MKDSAPEPTALITQGALRGVTAKIIADYGTDGFVRLNLIPEKHYGVHIIGTGPYALFFDAVPPEVHQRLCEAGEAYVAALKECKDRAGGSA